MSSEIYYDRAYIRVDDHYIPIVKHGSSNCFEFEFGREVPENQWSVLNYGYRGQLLFTEDEIRQIAARYEEYNSDNRGGVRKSRNRSFEVGEFGRWIEGGMKTAYTVEEYTACNNTVIVVEHTEPVWEKHIVQTTEELLDKLHELDGKSISISYLKSREFTHPYRRRKSSSWDPSKQSGFYVLRADNGYFSKRSDRRIWFDRNTPPTAASVRKFRTERQRSGILMTMLSSSQKLHFRLSIYRTEAMPYERIQDGPFPPSGRSTGK